MAAYTKLSDDKKLLSQNTVILPNGNALVTEVILVGDNDFITGSILLGSDDAVISGTWCGTCSGQSVGCVSCPNNDPVLDCVNRRIYCYS